MEGALLSPKLLFQMSLCGQHPESGPLPRPSCPPPTGKVRTRGAGWGELGLPAWGLARSQARTTVSLGQTRAPPGPKSFR